jgi:hypothetical protein
MLIFELMITIIIGSFSFIISVAVTVQPVAFEALLLFISLSLKEYDLLTTITVIAVIFDECKAFFSQVIVLYVCILVIIFLFVILVLFFIRFRQLVNYSMINSKQLKTEF